jgi:hypothetical protein
MQKADMKLLLLLLLLCLRGCNRMSNIFDS